MRRPLSLLALPVAFIATLALASCTSSGPSSGTQSSAAAVHSTRPSPSAASSPIGGPAGSLQAQYESVIGKVLPSIVEITTKVGLGSGIVYDSAGDIVTNDHVVGSAKTFQVRFSDSATPVKATLVGTFPPDDLAVIKVAGVSHLHPATFADSSNVKVGEIVLAMGNPLGLASSVTDGIVSAVGRTLTEPTSADSPGATLPDSIQTSAAINPGNSGGALVDLRGEVIGIPTLAATSQQEGGAAPGIGFAIPSNTVHAIASQLVKSGRVTRSGRAALGVGVATVTGPSGTGAGAGVETVVPGGPADKAGIRPGDVIVKIGKTPVTSTQVLSALLAGMKVGQQVSVTIVRSGTTRTVQVTLGELQSS
jgi:S1-C subfamily serine protease